MAAVDTPNRLKQARIRAGLSQARLAALAGFSAGWISLLEREPQFITPRAAERLAAVLGVRPEELQA